MHDPELRAFLESTVADALAGSPRISRVETLDSTPQWSVLRITLRDSAAQLVAKVAPPDGDRPPARRPVDFERTATAMAMAGAAGVPVAEVLAAHTATRPGERSYLLHRFVEGTEWRRVAPGLDDDAKRSVHRQLAGCALALQSVSLPAFGELGAEGGDIRTAMVHRAELRITDPRRREWFRSVLAAEVGVLAGEVPVLCHDDLHHGNVLLAQRGGAWQVSGVLDWDKAWAGPAESDVARMAFWDDMTGPAFWEVYRAARPATDAWDRAKLVHQLLWCLEYPDDGPRHRADTAALCRELGVGEPPDQG